MHVVPFVQCQLKIVDNSVIERGHDEENLTLFYANSKDSHSLCICAVCLSILLFAPYQ